MFFLNFQGLKQHKEMNGLTGKIHHHIFEKDFNRDIVITNKWAVKIDQDSQLDRISTNMKQKMENKKSEVLKWRVNLQRENFEVHYQKMLVSSDEEVPAPRCLQVGFIMIHRTTFKNLNYS